MENMDEYKKRLTLLLIEKAPSSDVQGLCRSILKEKVQTIFSDANEEWKRRVLQLCEMINLPLRVKAEVSLHKEKPKSMLWSYIGILVAIIVFSIAMSITESLFWSALLSALLGLGLNFYFINKNKGDEVEMPKSVYIDNSVEEIERYMDDVLNLFRAFLPQELAIDDSDSGTIPIDIHYLYPLDFRYIEILEFLNRVYVISENYGEECANFFRKRITELLENSGYELVEYSEDKKSWFDIEYATRLTETTMVKPVIRNLSRNKVIIKGKVFILSQET